MITQIAILGDFNPSYQTHHALNDSVRHILRNLNREIQFDWIGTDMFDHNREFRKLYSGLWIAPGSPYKDMDNVLEAIRFTRQHNIPTFGNCGGFQHMIIEFARNVCGISKADHQEINPDADDPVISKLMCSLVEQEEVLDIVDKDSILFSIVKQEKLTGRYFCSYGVNEKYIQKITEHGLSVTAVSPEKHVRAFELKSHPFFLGTLFQPALTSSMNDPDPIITAFVLKCLESKPA